MLIALPVSPSLGMLVERHDALSDRYKAQLMGGAFIVGRLKALL